MIRQVKPGAPLPFGAALKPQTIVAEAGDFDEDDGIRVVIDQNVLVLMGSFDGASFTLGITVTDLLEAIQRHGHANES